MNDITLKIQHSLHYKEFLHFWNNKFWNSNFGITYVLVKFMNVNKKKKKEIHTSSGLDIKMPESGWELWRENRVGRQSH